MKLSALLTAIQSEFPDMAAPTIDPEIKNVVSDSREVSPGCLFVALRGEKIDGHEYANQALQNGAEFVLALHPIGGAPPDRQLAIPDTRRALGLLASAFYGHPSRTMLTIGVTGTSGKTTTSYLIESILKTAGHRVGLIGTVSIRIDGREIPSALTTPGPITLQKILREMKDEGCTAVVMEVSSHALKQHRAIGVAFDGMVFTNLTPEHLDYHPDMEDYFQSKKILFASQADRAKKWGKSPKAAILGEDDYGVRLAEEIDDEAIHVDPSVVVDARGIRGMFSGVGIESELLARFNAENIACAVAIAKKLWITDESIRDGVKNLTSVPGRLERVRDPKGGRTILVDYAHKPDALEKVLKTLQGVKGSSRILTVFGCGGDRDNTKRPVMGEIACRLSDHVIITSDNPRTEDPAKIIAMIVEGVKGKTNFEVEADRKKAIEKAIAQAKPGDIVLIAGKGHETYQIVGTQKFDFDDREIARKAVSP